ncbi:MAG: hypothetical protein BXU00_02010 [Candidatus Nanoclepta minutus]|uniref:VapC9 PIN-like domain-containing protein n=1 Tax=Candidatus Nanoclepta minutus TaxID=1940235 RepID=A0A397WRK1_9ARCH|nr:MAG: hypothetical protein BXU00_02010 [Candidatus Nanoclepta minutus]
MRYKVLIDTNFFFIPFYERFDIIEELKNFLIERGIEYEGFYTLRKNIWEVENKLKTTKSENKRKLFKLVLDYIKKKDIRILDSSLNEKTDRLIVSTVLKDKWIVCTLDRQLRYILRRLKIPYIYYANRSLHIRW